MVVSENGVVHKQYVYIVDTQNIMEYVYVFIFIYLFMHISLYSIKYNSLRYSMNNSTEFKWNLL